MALLFVLWQNGFAQTLAVIKISRCIIIALLKYNEFSPVVIWNLKLKKNEM